MSDTAPSCTITMVFITAARELCTTQSDARKMCPSERPQFQINLIQPVLRDQIEDWAKSRLLHMIESTEMAYPRNTLCFIFPCTLFCCVPSLHIIEQSFQGLGKVSIPGAYESNFSLKDGGPRINGLIRPQRRSLLCPLYMGPSSAQEKLCSPFTIKFPSRSYHSGAAESRIYCCITSSFISSSQSTKTPTP